MGKIAFPSPVVLPIFMFYSVYDDTLLYTECYSMYTHSHYGLISMGLVVMFPCFLFLFLFFLNPPSSVMYNRSP